MFNLDSSGPKKILEDICDAAEESSAEERYFSLNYDREVALLIQAGELTRRTMPSAMKDPADLLGETEE